MRFDQIRARLFCAAIFSLLFVPPKHSYGQDGQSIIRGMVQTGSGEPLSGVSVVVKNSKSNFTAGTSTDSAGVFAFSKMPAGGPYNFTFTNIGYEPQTLSGYKIEGGTTLSLMVQMKSLVSSLNEVVVTGYTSQRKKDITGSVNIVNVSNMKAVPAGSPEQMLQGQASGLNITTSGEPGTESSVRIRGITSMGNNNPLVIIDGVQGSMKDINANDIESVQVLKDAGAAAIYGVRGSNGVIVITTKKGRNGKATVNYDGYYGVQIPPGGNVFNLLNTQEMADVTWKALRNSNQVGSNGNPSHTQYGNGAEPVIPDYIMIGNESGVTGEPTADQLDLYNINYTKGAIYQIAAANKTGTDWFHEIFKPAPIQSHSVSISGGAQKSNYFFSLGYFNQQGTLKNTYLKRYSVRSNSSFNIRDNIRVGENLYVVYKDNPRTHTGIQHESDVANPIALTFLQQPIIPVFDYFGNYAGSRAKSLGQSPSPYSLADRRGQNKNMESAIQGNIYAEADFLKYFTARTSYGGIIEYRNYYDYVFRTYENAENNQGNEFTEANVYNTNWTFTNTLTFSRKFGAHSIKFLAGVESVHTYGRSVGGNSKNYFTDDPDYRILTNGSSAFTNFSTVNKESLSSQFGRIDYNLNDKYLINGTLRRDGSSRFGNQKRWGIFPSVSAGWRISEEKFLKSVSWLSNLIIKGSWGKLGNQLNVDPGNAFNQYGGTLTTSYYDINGTSNSTVQGFMLTRIGNSSTGWEEDILTNAGFDAAILKGKFDLSVEYYEKKINGLLFIDQAPATVGGATLPTVNLGNIINKGVDISSTYHGKIGKEFRFDITANITHYKSRISHIPNNYFDAGTTRTGSFVRNQVGHPIGAFFGYQITGLFQSADEISKAPAQDAAAPGRFRYQDTNGDNKISDADRTFIGDPNPDFTYGLNISLGNKVFDFSMFFYGSQGNDAVNYPKWWTDFYPSFTGVKSKNLLYDSWSPDNPGARTPIAENSNNFSTNAVTNSYYVENASFLKLRSVVLGYTLPSNALSRIGISKLRVFVQGANLFIITPYSGLDPELGGSSAAFGIDYGNYPNNQRNYNAGVSLTF